GEPCIVAHGECVHILRPGDKTTVGKFECAGYGDESESDREAHAKPGSRILPMPRDHEAYSGQQDKDTCPERPEPGWILAKPRRDDRTHDEGDNDLIPV